MKEKILLIDGNSIINRAYYAIPLLTNKDGLYTNAVYGFLNILFKFIDEENPDFIGVCFDLPKPTFRHEKFADYKGTRKRMPDELRPQLPLLKKLLDKMNIAVFELEGFEADDVLGTLCNKSLQEDLVPVIISGDRDLLQLSTDTVKIRIPKTKQGKTEVEDYYESDVLEKYGVTPKQFIDVKALMGDASDNVPGVPGIGEKTALKIIDLYKSLESAIDNASDIKPVKASENLIAFKEQALLSKELVTIITDAPVMFKKEETKIIDIFNHNAYEMFKELNFKSMLQRFELKNVRTPKIAEPTNYKCITESRLAVEYINKISTSDYVCYKIISEDGRLFGVSFSSEDDRGTFVKTGHDISEEELLRMSKCFFEGETKKIAHNAKNDIVFLKKHNVAIENLFFDTMIAGYILDSTKETYEYNDLAVDFLNETYKSFEDIVGKGKTKKDVGELDDAELLNLACMQADISYRVFGIMRKNLEKQNQNELYFDIELPLIRVLADMEMYGIKVNKDELIRYGEELKGHIEQLTSEIYMLAGCEFNINSPKQLGVVLFETLGLKGGKKTKTGYSTSADVLEKLRSKHDIIDRILDYRTYMKLKTTYADGLLNVLDRETEKIHSTFNQAVTATGRISSTEPNLQNIPVKIELGRRLRKAFVPSGDEYVFIDADYSQIELRVLAHMSQDETLINAFKSNQDIHRLTASQVLKIPFEMVTPAQRSNAKAVNFGIVYGIGGFSLSQDLGISKKEADRYIEGYFEKYPMVKIYMDETVENARKNGYAETIFGRKRLIPELSSTNFNVRAFGERVAMNMPVQGSAADIIKIAMVKVSARLSGLKSKLILQVHDELLIETHKSELETVRQILKDEMENAVKLLVPLDIDIHEGKNWYEVK